MHIWNIFQCSYLSSFQTVQSLCGIKGQEEFEGIHLGCHGEMLLNAVHELNV